MATKHTRGDEAMTEPEDTDGSAFDEFARRAGHALRSAAPEHGLTAVVRRGNSSRTRRVATEIGVVGALIVVGIVVFTTERGRDGGPTIGTGDTASSDVPSTVPHEELERWFANYTGSPPVAASGAPVKFGVVMPSLTYQIDLQSAADYLNDHAGGVGGRPIEIDACQAPLAECADRFAADPDLVAVLENRWSGDSIGTALAGRKPLHTTYSGAGTLGVAYYPTYRETVNAMALQAEKLTKSGQRILVIDAAVDQDLLDDPKATAFVTPDVSASLEDREVVRVKASDSEPLVATIRRSGPTDFAAVVLATPPEDQVYVVHPSSRLVCDELSDALDEIGSTPAVIVDACEAHQGWYRVDVGFNESSPDLESGALPISSEIQALGRAKGTAADRGIREVGALLAVIRVINHVGGPAQADPARLAAALRDFSGPLPISAGPLDCSPTGKVAERVEPGSCVRYVDVHQFVHGTWIDQEPIDLAA